MSTISENTENVIPRKCRAVPRNYYLDPKDYSRYSFNPTFLAEVTEVMECISYLDDEFEGPMLLLELLIEQSLSRNLKLELIRDIDDMGLAMAIGTDVIPNFQGNVPIRWEFLRSMVPDTVPGAIGDYLKPYIEAGYINKHYTVETSNILEILITGLETYIANIALNYNSFQELTEHLLHIGNKVNISEMGQDNYEIYATRIYNRVTGDSDFRDNLETIWKYHTIHRNEDLRPLIHLSKEEQAKYLTPDSYNVIHSYLRLWQTEDTTQKDI